MTMVKKKYKNESFDAMMRRFKRRCEKNNVLSALKDKEYYEKPSTKRKLAKEIAVKKELQRQRDQDINRW